MKNDHFLIFFTFAAIEVTRDVNFCLVFDLYRVARACLNILVFARMQFECNLVTKITSKCTKNHKNSLFCVFFGVALASNRPKLKFWHPSIVKWSDKNNPSKNCPVFSIVSKLNA